MSHERAVINGGIEIGASRWISQTWISMNELAGQEKGKPDVDAEGVDASEIKCALGNLTSPKLPAGQICVLKIEGLIRISIGVTAQKIYIVKSHEYSGTVDEIICRQWSPYARCFLIVLHPAVQRNHTVG